MVLNHHVSSLTLSKTCALTYLVAIQKVLLYLLKALKTRNFLHMPPFDQSEQSDGSGLVLVLFCSWFNKPFKNQTALPPPLLCHIISHCILLQFLSIVWKSYGRLH